MLRHGKKYNVPVVSLVQKTLTVKSHEQDLIIIICKDDITTDFTPFNRDFISSSAMKLLPIKECTHI